MLYTSGQPLVCIMTNGKANIKTLITKASTLEFLIWGPKMGIAFLTSFQALLMLMLVQGPLLYEVKGSNPLSPLLPPSHVKTFLYRVFPTKETLRI